MRVFNIVDIAASIFMSTVGENKQSCRVAVGNLLL